MTKMNLSVDLSGSDALLRTLRTALARLVMQIADAEEPRVAERLREIAFIFGDVKEDV